MSRCVCVSVVLHGPGVTGRARSGAPSAQSASCMPEGLQAAIICPNAGYIIGTHSHICMCHALLYSPVCPVLVWLKSAFQMEAPCCQPSLRAQSAKTCARSAAQGGNHRVSLKCQYLEIYNETITDLLRPNSTNLQLREHYKRGCHVEGLAEVTALNCAPNPRLNPLITAHSSISYWKLCCRHAAWSPRLQILWQNNLHPVLYTCCALLEWP